MEIGIIFKSAKIKKLTTISNNFNAIKNHYILLLAYKKSPKLLSKGLCFLKYVLLSPTLQLLKQRINFCL
jgi:hypothetical protein